jgi:hypothetical protein
MKQLTLTLVNDNDAVRADFKDARIEGSIVVGTMASPDYVQFKGEVTINGVAYSVSSNCSVEATKRVEDWALHRVDDYFQKGTIAARDTFTAALSEIVKEVVKVEEFVQQQKRVQIYYVGLDISREKSNLKALKEKVLDAETVIAELEAKEKSLSKGLLLEFLTESVR